MIGTELLKGQGLGNALFCYVTARCIAKKQNTEHAILGKEVLEGIAGRNNGLYFMNLDFGKSVEISDFRQVYHEKDDRLFLGNSRHDCSYTVGVVAARNVVVVWDCHLYSHAVTVFRNRLNGI